MNKIAVVAALTHTHQYSFLVNSSIQGFFITDIYSLPQFSTSAIVSNWYAWYDRFSSFLHCCSPSGFTKQGNCISVRSFIISDVAQTLISLPSTVHIRIIIAEFPNRVCSIFLVDKILYTVSTIKSFQATAVSDRLFSTFLLKASTVGNSVVVVVVVIVVIAATCYYPQCILNFNPATFSNAHTCK